MPWTLAREGQTLRVELTPPLDTSDLDRLVLAIGNEIADGAQIVVLPTIAPDGSSASQATLTSLWETLPTHGVVVQRDDSGAG